MKRRGTFRGGEIKPDLTKKHISVSRVPFYRQPGFKRSIGFVFLGIGQIVGGAAGLTLQGIGGLVGVVGLAHAAKRSTPATDGQEGLWYQLLQILTKIISHYIKKEK